MKSNNRSLVSSTTELYTECLEIVEKLLSYLLFLEIALVYSILRALASMTIACIILVDG